MILTSADKGLLLSLVHKVILNHVMIKKTQLHKIPAPSETVKINCGVFVSLYVDGKLRGCIGTFSEENTLYKNVQNMALSAATTDTRFKPIAPPELTDLSIEISVLSPKERIYNVRDIIIGKHGIYIEKGLNRGTLLPQVAINQNWSVEEFLGNCAKYKAGIGWDGWKSAHLFIYEAFIFSNTEIDEEH